MAEHLASDRRHAVRWFQRRILRGADEQWSRWHATDDASFTLCGHSIPIFGDHDGPSFPEDDDDLGIVDCRRCLRLLATQRPPITPQTNGNN